MAEARSAQIEIEGPHQRCSSTGTTRSAGSRAFTSASSRPVWTCTRHPASATVAAPSATSSTSARTSSTRRSSAPRDLTRHRRLRDGAVRSQSGISLTCVGVPPDVRAAATRQNGGDEEERPMDAEIAPGLHATRHWHALSDGRVQCDVCPRGCRLREGQRGLCFVRMRAGRASCSRATAARAGSASTRSRRSRSTTSSPARRPVVRDGGLQPRLPVLPELGHHHVAARRTRWRTPPRPTNSRRCRAAGLPKRRLHLQRAGDLPRVRRRHRDRLPGARDRAVAVTNGYLCPGPRAELYAHLDAANIDLKAFDETSNEDLPGAARAGARDARVRAPRNPLLARDHDPGDPRPQRLEREIDALTRWVAGTSGADVPLHFSAFHPGLSMSDRPPTPVATLTRARSNRPGERGAPCLAGNVQDPEGGTTYCHACGEPLIVRDGYAIEAWRLDASGRCRRCGTACAGVFEAHPGTWGPRRLPVRIAAMSGQVRTPAVAGLFLPAEPEGLAATVDDLLATAHQTGTGSTPHAIVVPHAGYAYSGPVAAVAYSAVGATGCRGSARPWSRTTRTTSRSRVQPSPRPTPGRTPLGVVPVARGPQSRRAPKRCGTPPICPTRPSTPSRSSCRFSSGCCSTSSRCCRWSSASMQTDAVADLVAALWGGKRHARRRVHRPQPLSRRRSGTRARPDGPRRRSPACGPEAIADEGACGSRALARPRRARPQGRSHDRAPRTRHLGRHGRRPLPGGRLRRVRSVRVERSPAPRDMPGNTGT